LVFQNTFSLRTDSIFFCSGVYAALTLYYADRHAEQAGWKIVKKRMEIPEDANEEDVQEEAGVVNQAFKKDQGKEEERY